MNKEIRTLDIVSELRTVGDSRNVEGYGIVFNKESRDLGGFTEIILPEAIEGVIEKSDVLALMNHNDDRGILARSVNGKGSLSMTVDAKGVKYGFESPHTALGDELVEGIKRKDITGSSFAFTTLPDGESWDRDKEGKVVRTIKKFDKIYDMSPCYREAYQDTTVALRSLGEYNKISEGVIEGKTNPPIAKTIDENLDGSKPMNKLSNAELVLRARVNLERKRNNI